MNLIRIVGLVVAIPLIVFGLFLLLRGDPGDGFMGPFIVGLTALGIGLLVLAATFVGGNRRTSPVVLLVVAAVLPYDYLVGPSGFVLNLALAIVAAFVFWRGSRAGR